MLTRARDAFWATGPVATSISDLCTATGLVSGSIYKAFGSKAGLYHATLDAYLTSAIDWTRDVLGDPDTPRVRLETWLDGMASQFGSDTSGPVGCYAVQGATALGDIDDPWVRQRLAAHDRALLDEVSGALARLAAAEGADQAGRGDHVLRARLLLALMNGLAVEARKGITTAEAQDLLRAGLGQLT